MLLLVLILVLAAFALLVLALVQGSVLWAWLSVVVSVAAASALLFDWWQRQQASRDEEPLPPAPTPVPGGPAHPQVDSVDADSVTEFIPVVSRQGPAPAPPEDETRFLPQEQPTSVEPPVANEQTIVLPVARPPGSADQPPGATPSVPLWAAPQSQSVTNAASSPPVTPSPPTGGRPDPVPAGEETVLQPVDPRSVVGAGPQRTNGAPVGDGDPNSPPAGDRPPTGGLFTAPVAEDATSAVPAQAPQPAHEPAQQQPQQPPADEHAEAEATELAMPALPPAGPDGEPPEEPREPAAAAIVATLEDEVVVVDERPRYHVAGCPFLPGRPVIPLPAREAVELGFTPCGWCGPNRLLAERHPAAAR